MSAPLWPVRLQQRRTKGWRKPSNAVSVARPHFFGNPFVVSEHQTREQAVANFRAALLEGRLQFSLDRVRHELRGHDLMCWCPLDQACHADVLLEMANGAPDSTTSTTSTRRKR